MNNLLIYADNQYYHLKYDLQHTSNTKPFKLHKIVSKKLHNVLPKQIYSHSNSHCIIDIDNNIHHVLLNIKDNHNYDDSVPIRAEIFMYIGNTKSDNYSVICYDSYMYNFNNRRTCHITILMVHKENNEILSYKYLKFIIMVNISELQIVHDEVLLPDQVTYYQGMYMFTITTGENTMMTDNDFPTGPQYNIKSATTKTIKDNLSMDITYLKVSINKKYLDYSITVDHNNDCHLVNTNKEITKISTLTTDSVLLFDNNQVNNTMIITNNHIIIILRDHKILQFNLPVKHLYYIANTKVKNLIWSKELYQILSNKYKALIITFMLCNRQFGNYKIPHCLLPTIFTIIIN